MRIVVEKKWFLLRLKSVQCVIFVISVCRLLAVESFSFPSILQKRKHHVGVSSFKRTSSLSSTEENVNFAKWVDDQIEEVESPIDCLVKGKIPRYVSGTLLRNGCAQWGTTSTTANGTSKQRYGHIFDGLAKVTRYHINGKDNTVTFATKFLESRQRQASNEKLLPGINVGPIMNSSMTSILNDANFIEVMLNAISFDNPPVNVWDYFQKHVVAITDAPVQTKFDPETLETMEKAKNPPFCQNANGYELLSTAHPEYCKSGTGCTYNVIMEVNPLTGNRVSLIKEQIVTDKNTRNKWNREIVASTVVPDGAIPYIHSFGLTETKAMILLPPLRLGLNKMDQMIKEGFMSTMNNCGTTRVIVFDLLQKTALANVELEEPLYFYHAISCVEDTAKSTISLKLCGYKTPDIMTGKDAFFRLDRIDNRDNIAFGGLCEVQLDLQNKQTTVKWTDVVTTNTKYGTKTIQGFELPTTRFSRWNKNDNDPQSPPWKNGQHPKYAYAYGAFANGSKSYDAWNLLKINLHTGEAISFRERDSCYYSEPIFVPNPNGKEEEDDGVLLCQRYDGRNNESSLIIIDAQTMDLLAEAKTGMRNPMDFHGTFLSSQ